MWKCPNCETVNSTNRCTVCGREMPSVNSNVQQTDGKIFCGKCGAMLEAGTVFCGECGSPVKRTDVSVGKFVFCANCGERMPEHLQICAKCGRKIYGDINEPETEEQPKNNFVIIAFIVIILIAFVLGILLYNKSENGDTENKEDKESSEPHATENVNTASPEPTAYTETKKKDKPVEPSAEKEDLVCTFVKNVDSTLNVRSLPKHKSDLVGTIDSDAVNMYFYGDIQKGLGSDNKEHDWYYIETDDGIKGYVRSDLVIEKESAKSNSDVSHAFTKAEASSVRSAMKDTNGKYVYYDAQNVLDGNYNTCWAMDLSTNIQPSVTVSSESKQKISGVKFSNGYFKSKDVYAKNRKITKVEILYDGGSLIYECESEQYNIMQNVKFDSTVKSDYVTINILDSASAECNDLCISEIEVY